MDVFPKKEGACRRCCGQTEPYGVPSGSCTADTVRWRLSISYAAAATDPEDTSIRVEQQTAES